MDCHLLKRPLWMHQMLNLHSKIFSLVFLSFENGLTVLEIYRIVSSKALDQQGDPSRVGAGDPIKIGHTTTEPDKKNNCC